MTYAFEQLHTLGYVSHTRYHGVELTEAGEVAAAELVRHHRLLELFLFRVLGLSLEQVAGEAEQLEHVLSEMLEERIDALLDHPSEDLHGNPIPDMCGKVHVAPSVGLPEVSVGKLVRIQRITTEDMELIHYLGSLGLVPGTVARLESRTTYGDVFTLRVEKNIIPVGAVVAASLQVRILQEDNEKQFPP